MADYTEGSLYDEFLAATKDLPFAKDFNTSLEAIMHDELATTGQRALAWIKRRSWGRCRLFCVQNDGETPALQRDCCAELKIDKTTLSHAISYLEKRGYIRYEDKVLFPVIAPELRGPDPKSTRSAEFAAFFEDWKVANSAQAKKLAEARDTLKRIRVVVLSEYKKSRASETNGGTSLIKTRKTQERSLSVSQEPPEDRLADPPEPTPEPPPEPAPTIEEVRALITEETAQTHSQEVPGDPVCRDTIANLQGAPTERLRRAIRERFRPRDKIGRIAYLATDVGKRWAMEQQEQQRIAAEQRTREREALEWMAENDENEDARQVARAKLTGKT